MLGSQLLNLDAAQILALLGVAGLFFAMLLARYLAVVGPLSTPARCSCSC